MTKAPDNSPIAQLVAAAKDRDSEFRIESLANPQWDEAEEWSRDWRYYVQEPVRRCWSRLPASARLVAFINAADIAYLSEWRA